MESDFEKELIKSVKSIDTRLQNIENKINALHITKGKRIGVANIPVPMGNVKGWMNKVETLLEELVAAKKVELTN